MRSFTERRESLLPKGREVRALALATLTSRFGRGLFYTILPIYLTRSVGLSVHEVGIGLTAGALVGLLGGVPGGRLADRVGPRLVRTACRFAEALMICGYLAIGGLPGFVVTAALVTLCESAGQAAEGALIARAVDRNSRVRTRAYLRSVTNAGWMVGSALAGVALLSDTSLGYQVVIVTSALCYAVSAVVTTRVPLSGAAPEKNAAGRPVAVLRDRPYLALTALNALLTLNIGVFTVALPLYMAQRTHAPVALYAVFSVINTVVVMLFQVRASRRTETATGAARAQRRAGYFLLACCLCFAVADGTPAWVAVVFLFLGVGVHVVGELLHAAGSWGISFELAPEHAQGEYQGVYGVGRDLAQVVTPLVATTAMAGWGWAGCVLLGVVFLATGCLVPPATRWAIDHGSRPAPTPT
ncbi:MFS transporter [Saccharopolyspora sp. NPDC000995]